MSTKHNMPMVPTVIAIVIFIVVFAMALAFS